MKPIMDILMEKPLKKWMKLYVLLLAPSRCLDTIKRQRKIDDKREFNFMIKKTHRGYVLAEGKWESKKTLKDYLSYLNQYSDKEDPIKINLYNYRPFGNCDFVVDMLALKRSFKKLKFTSLMIRDDNNEWWTITHQLD